MNHCDVPCKGKKLFNTSLLSNLSPGVAFLKDTKEGRQSKLVDGSVLNSVNVSIFNCSFSVISTISGV